MKRALDQDQYNYITATYYLLAERVLKKEYLKRKRLKYKHANKKSKKSLTHQSNQPNAASAAATTALSSGQQINNNNINSSSAGDGMNQPGEFSSQVGSGSGGITKAPLQEPLQASSDVN